VVAHDVDVDVLLQLLSDVVNADVLGVFEQFEQVECRICCFFMDGLRFALLVVHVEVVLLYVDQIFVFEEFATDFLSDH
jgi:hypothetical protein